MLYVTHLLSGLCIFAANGPNMLELIDVQDDRVLEERIRYLEEE